MPRITIDINEQDDGTWDIAQVDRESDQMKMLIAFIDNYIEKNRLNMERAKEYLLTKPEARELEEIKYQMSHLNDVEYRIIAAKTIRQEIDYIMGVAKE